MSNSKRKDFTGHSKGWSVLVPVIVTVYFLFGLLMYMFLQGDLNDFDAFMRNDAVANLLVLYLVVGAVGLTAVMLFKRSPNLLGSSRRTMVTCFLIAIIVGTGVFTFLTFTATEANYVWMHDGVVYRQMAQSFLTNHEFIVEGEYIHHLGPVFPLFLSPFYVFLPVQLGTQIADETSFILALFVVFFITKKMYATIPALITTMLVATFPIYLFATSRNFAEPLVLIMFTITLYFILESLKPEKQNRIIIAGLTAAIGFLIKSSFGYFFMIAGVAGFLWRFYYMRWRVLKNKNYILAIILFLSLLLVWTARNLYHFWDGTFQNLFVAAQPSEYMNVATNYTLSLQHLSSFFTVALFFSMYTLFFMMGYTWLFADYLKKLRRRIREERISCLTLSVMLTIVIGLNIIAVYFVYENSYMPDYVSYFPQMMVRYFLTNFGRYSFIIFVPLSWLAYELAKSKSAQKALETSRTNPEKLY